MTGKNEHRLEEDALGKLKITKIKEGLMPECFPTKKGNGRKEFLFLTPHTPLNWAVIEMVDPFFVRRMHLSWCRYVAAISNPVGKRDLWLPTVFQSRNFNFYRRGYRSSFSSTKSNVSFYGI